MNVNEIQGQISRKRRREHARLTQQGKTKLLSQEIARYELMQRIKLKQTMGVLKRKGLYYIAWIALSVMTCSLMYLLYLVITT